MRGLVGLAIEHARTTYPAFAATAADKRALTRSYRGLVRNLGTILVEERRERAVREAVATQTVYHLSGLEAVFTGVPRPGKSAGGRAR